jgi:hypothetical protein
MEENTMKHFFVLGGAVILAALWVTVVAACELFMPKEEESIESFAKAPKLTISPANGTIACTWTPSEPAADSYDVYYYEGTALDADTVKTGTKIENTPRIHTISGLTNGKKYSVVVTARKESYASVDSNVSGATVKNVKRGVSYSFKPTSTTTQEMNLLAPANSTTGIKWFYNWDTKLDTAIDTQAKSHNVAYFPMSWNDVNETELRKYVNGHPECNYLLAYNEPNLTDQANMTPTKAAEKWPRLLAIAKELNLKIVSPAMNYGTLANYGDPIKWLDDFFAKPGVSIGDIAAISIHCYMADAGALKSYIERFKKYDKPIWMTEFCAWENWMPNDAANGTKHQMEYLSQVVTYMELDPDVERYAWFIPKRDDASTEATFPFMHLLTKGTPALTDMGKVYVNMSICDKSVYAEPDKTIQAEHFTDCNISTSIGETGLSRSVNFRPSSDTNGVLDIYDFNSGKWVEYQVNVPTAKDYTISLRNKTTSPTTIQVYVDGSPKRTVSLNSAEWTTTTSPAIQMTAGKHTIRLEVTNGGTCELNWLKVE